MSAAAALTSAFLLGITGSVHCAVMCGPLATVIGGSCHRGGIASHAGRATTYALLGALLGAVGERVASSATFGIAALGSRFLVGATLVLAGLALVGVKPRWSILLPGSRGLARLRARIGMSGDEGSVLGAYVRGLAWGLLPCGLLYGALALAAASGSLAAGAGVMIVFALATTPVFAILAMFTRRASTLLRARLLRHAGALVLVGAGLCHLALLLDEHALAGLHQPRPCCESRRRGVQ